MRVRVVAAIAAGLLAAGCASIPDSGSVEAGDRINQEAPGALSVIPPGPQEDAEPAQIVRGFIEAAAIQVEAARDFLTADAQQQWEPSQTIVYAGEPVIYADDRRATVLVDAVATIGDGGRYEPVAPNIAATPPGEYTLTRVDGQWRLSGVPDSILVAEDDLGRLLRPYRVYFGDRAAVDAQPLGRYLVPDVRWFPARTESATRLARAVLDGPSAPLAGSVESVNIPDLALTNLGVEVRDGIATVDFNEAFRGAGDREDALLRLQLTETLTALPSVSDVRFTVRGNPAGPRPVPGRPPTTEPDVPVSGPYVLRRATVAEPAAETVVDPAPVDPAPVEPVPDATVAAPSPTDAPPAAGDVAVERPRIEQIDESGEPAEIPQLRRLADRIHDGLAVSPSDPDLLLAGVAAGGTTIWANTPSGGTQELVRDGVDLTAPSFDNDGWLWTVSQAPTPALTESDQAAAEAWPGPWFIAVKDDVSVMRPLSRLVTATDRVTTFELSRDGTRVLLVVEGADRSIRVQVAGVVRDAGGEPRSLSVSSFRLLPDLVEAVDATWVQSDTVAVLGSTSPGEVRPFVVQVGGVADELPPVAKARSITAGRGDRTIVIGTDDGTVVSREGGSWSRDPQPGWSPAY